MKSFQEGSQGTGTARNELEVVLLGSPDVVASTPQRWSDSAQEIARTG